MGAEIDEQALEPVLDTWEEAPDASWIARGPEDLAEDEAMAAAGALDQVASVESVGPLDRIGPSVDDPRRAGLPVLETTVEQTRDHAVHELPSAAAQERLEEAVGLDATGHYVAGTDPERLVGLVNQGDQHLDYPMDAGPTRRNNCADCSLAFASTWLGGPETSAQTTDPAFEGELPDRIEAWAGGPMERHGRGQAGMESVAQRVRQAGPSSVAIVGVEWAGSDEGHAFNLVEDADGRLVWCDAQWGVASQEMLYGVEGTGDEVDRVFAVVLDRKGEVR